MMDAVTVLLCLTTFILLFLGKMTFYPSHTSSLWRQNSVLLVTAHPDDECMFFGPVISCLLDQGVPVHILCLSTGNWYGQGETRRKEFHESCTALGISDDDRHMIDDDELPDNPAVEWGGGHILKYVKEYIERWNISALLTFDKHGVSGHANHISIFHAVKDYPGISVYTLLTVNTMRKYISVFDVFVALTLKERICFTQIGSLAKPFIAMTKHRSQLLWFRYLYMMFSRYMLFSSIEQVT